MAAAKLAKQVLRKEVKLKLSNLSEAEKKRESAVVIQMVSREILQKY